MKKVNLKEFEEEWRLVEQEMDKMYDKFGDNVIEYPYKEEWNLLIERLQVVQDVATGVLKDYWIY